MRLGRPALALLGCLQLGACSIRSPAIKQCEDRLLSTLKAPASYKLIDSLVGLPEKDGKQNVFLTYDAVNTFNAPIRDKFWCVFDPKAGSAEPGGAGADTVADDLEADIDNATAEPPARTRQPAASKHVAPAVAEYQDEVPVCDRPDSASKRALMKEIGTNCLGE